jgi:hypothetical protein
MRQKGVLLTRREGTTIHYRLATPSIGEACKAMRQVLLEALAASGSTLTLLRAEAQAQEADPKR